jgi:hypothetical protein
VSNATHNDADAHEIPRNPSARSTWATVQPRLLGPVETITFPPSSTAAHNLADGHETPSAIAPRKYTTLHDDASPPGRFETTTPPASSTATHNLADGHETATRLPRDAYGPWWSTNTGDAHDNGPAARATVPAPSTSASGATNPERIKNRSRNPLNMTTPETRAATESCVPETPARAAVRYRPTRTRCDDRRSLTERPPTEARRRTAGPHGPSRR